MHGNRYMRIFENLAHNFLKKAPLVIKFIKETEKIKKKKISDLGRNPIEIVHGPFEMNLNKRL